jgi:hypothetical protein
VELLDRMWGVAEEWRATYTRWKGTQLADIKVRGGEGLAVDRPSDAARHSAGCDARPVSKIGSVANPVHSSVPALLLIDKRPRLTRWKSLPQSFKSPS